MKDNMIRILIVDDHPLFRNGIRPILEEQPYVLEVLEADNGEECLRCLNEVRVNVVLLDVQMPVMDGFECLRRIREKWQDVKVVALTQFDQKRFIRQMFHLVANGYLLKTTSERNLIYLLEAVVFEDARVTSQELTNIDMHENPKKDPDYLGVREMEVLTLLCDQYNSKEIAEKLNISKNTVDNIRTSLLQKSEARNIAGLVRWAYVNRIV